VHTFIDLYFAPESVSPLDLAARIRESTGLEFIIGPHDLAFEWSTVEEFRATLARLHGALKGSGVLYRVETAADEPTYVEPVPWPPPIRDRGPAHHPAYDRPG
jgi:hypothetical protein